MTALATALTTALINFTWQGVFLGCLLWITLMILRNRSAHVRYLVSCSALVMMSAVPVITACLAFHPDVAGPVSAAVSVSEVFHPSANVAQGMPWLASVQMWALPAWALGVLLFSCRLIWGCSQISLLKRRATPADEPIRAIVERLARRMGLSRTVDILTSLHAESPSVAGILRPVILLPVSSLTGLTPQQLEAILAHELAHIRRFDPMVNAMQILVETLLFYHPAIWWVSARIRHERELCCDDLALRSCGDAMCYARALAVLEKLRATPVAMVLGSTDGPLLYRIQRIMGMKISDYSPSKVSGILAVLLAVVCLAIQPVTRMHAQATPPASGMYRNVGVQADTAGGEVVEPIRYPRSAWGKAVQGMVVAQLDVDGDGAVSDARILSGPQELRKPVLHSVLSWRYKAEGRPSTRQVSVEFHVPAEEEMRSGMESDVRRQLELQKMMEARDAALQSMDRQQAAVAEAKAKQDELLQMKARSMADLAAVTGRQAEIEMSRQREALESAQSSVRAQLEQQLSAGGEPQRMQALKAELQALAEQMQQMQRQKSNLDAESRRPETMTGRTLARINFVRLPEEQREQLVKRLPVKVGETLTRDVIDGLGPALRAFDQDLTFDLIPMENNQAAIVILVTRFTENEVPSRLQDEIRQKEEQLAAARQVLTDSHPDVLALRERIEELKKERARLAEGYDRTAR